MRREHCSAYAIESKAPSASPRCAHSPAFPHSTPALPESCQPIRMPPAWLSHRRRILRRHNRPIRRRRVTPRQDSETLRRDVRLPAKALSSVPPPSLAIHQASALPPHQVSPPAAPSYQSRSFPASIHSSIVLAAPQLPRREPSRWRYRKPPPPKDYLSPRFVRRGPARATASPSPAPVPHPANRSKCIPRPSPARTPARCLPVPSPPKPE